jgi:hypothetical protein
MPAGEPAGISLVVTNIGTKSDGQLYLTSYLMLNFQPFLTSQILGEKRPVHWNLLIQEIP